MESKLRSKILEILDENRIMSVATLRPDGWPQATTVGYVNEGLRLYFLCARDSQKAKNLAWDDRVSLTIDHDVANPMAIRGLSLAGHAAPITEREELQRLVGELMNRKYPEYSDMISEEALSGMEAFEVTPKVISVLDYAQGFGQHELVEVGEGDLGPG